MKIDCFRCREEGTTRAGTTDVAPHGWGSYHHRGVPFYLCPRCETEFGREAPYPGNEAWNVECERCGSAFPDRVNEPATFRQWGRAFPDDSGSGVCLNCDARHPRIERLRIRGFHTKSVDDLLRVIADRIGESGHGFVFPYIQMHEFEGLLFSNVEAFESLLAQAPVDALRGDHVLRTLSSPTCGGRCGQ